MNTDLIKVNPQEFGLNEETAKTITNGLAQILTEREVLAAQYQQVIALDIDDSETAKTAKKLRLLIKDNRTKGITNWHKTNKEFYLRGGQFVDAIKNKEIVENERMEEMLEKIEKNAEIKETNRIAQLQIDRNNEVAEYAEFIPQGLNLGAILEDDYNKLLDGAKLQQKAKIERLAKEEEERIAAAKKEEEERIERERVAAEEKAKMEAENARLKAEAEAKEKELAIERAKQEEERNKIEAEAQRKVMEAEAKAKAEREAAAKLAAEEKDKQDAIISKQKAENDRIAAELKAKQEAEEKEAADKLAAEEAALAAPDKDKLVAIGKLLTAIEMPDVKSKKAQKIVAELKANLDAAIAKFRTDFTNQYK